MDKRYRIPVGGMGWRGAAGAPVALYVVLPMLGAGQKCDCIVSCAVLYVVYV